MLHIARTMAGVWVLVATTVLTLHQATAAPIVDAPWGRIQGLDAVSVSGLNYSSYLAIPFALPPVGELRFAKPVAHPGYRDGRVFNATTLGNGCMQVVFDAAKAASMSEDCLTLNVYVPGSPSTGLRNVMVWIHGGRFVFGEAAAYSPTELVTGYDVIVVVIQYRLDSLGFLSTGDDTVPGNFGLWDQNLAIRWVKTNIGAFGGDPESMTVFGQSAGAASVGYQVISPASRGMKYRAILQSGTPLARWAVNKNPYQAFSTLANQTGCLDGVVSSWTSSISYYFTSEAQKRAERERVLTCLRRLDAKELIRPNALNDKTPWTPVVDGNFIPKDPVQMMSDVAYLDAVGATERDIMIGVNNEESAMFLTAYDNGSSKEGTPKEGDTAGTDKDGEDGPNEFVLDRSEVVRSTIAEELVSRYGEGLQKETQRLDTLVNSVEFFYTEWTGSSAGKVSTKNMVDALSDVAFVLSSVDFVRDLANAKAKTSAPGRPYLYLFNHYPDFKAGDPEPRGTSHGEEIVYLFDLTPEVAAFIGVTGNDLTISSTFRTMLTSFSKTGQPQVPLLNSGVNVWPEFTLTEENYLSLEVVPRVADHLYGQRMALWTDLVPSLYNSTRTPEPNRYWTWQQQQQQMWNYNRPACQQMGNGMAKAFTFTGRLNFFKLH